MNEQAFTSPEPDRTAIERWEGEGVSTIAENRGYPIMTRGFAA